MTTNIYNDIHSTINNTPFRKEDEKYEYEKITWESFLNSDSHIDKRLALQELIYILKNWNGSLDSMSELINNKVFASLITDENDSLYSMSHSYPASIQLKTLIDIIPKNIKHQSPGVIIDACIVFSLFYMSKQLAGATGYVMRNDLYKEFSIKPDGNFDSKIFNIETREDSKITDRYFNEEVVDLKIITNNSMHVFNKLLPIFGQKNTYYTGFNFTDNSTKDYYTIQMYKLLNPRQYIGSNWITNNTFKKLALDTFKHSDEYLADKNKSEDKLKTDIYDILKRIGVEANKVLLYHVESFFYMLLQITGNMPQIATIASGSGSNTNGLINMENLGIILFQYDYSGNTINSSNKISSISVEPGDILHLNIFGLDASGITEKNKIEISDSSDSLWTIEFESNMQTHNGVRMVRNSYTEPSEYIKELEAPKEDPSNPATQEDFTDTTFYKITTTGTKTKKERIAVFNRDTNDLFFIKKCSLTIKLTSASLDSDSDEIVLFVSKITDYRKPLGVIHCNTFESNKFELQKNEIEKLYANNKELFNKIIENLKEVDDNNAPIFTITNVNLTGEFIGKPAEESHYSQDDIVADSEYLLNLGEKHERLTIPQNQTNNYIKLRQSRLVIQTDYEQKTISISIVSYTSPEIADFETAFSYAYETQPDFEDLKNNYTKPNYTVLGTNKPSQNQVLAMLRSMGTFEAVYEILNKLAVNNTELQNRLSTLITSALSIDKTGSARSTNENNYEELNLANTLPYSKYIAYKWYKDADDYGKYLHDNSNLNLE